MTGPGERILRPFVQMLPDIHPGDGVWSLIDLCTAYNWPTALTGGGSIAIVEIGGGYLPGDITTHATLNGYLPPTITNHNIDGVNNPGVFGGDSLDAEVTLDIQISAAAYSFATSQSANIHIYWCDGTVPSAIACINIAAEQGHAVMSLSWGANEIVMGAVLAQQMEDAILNATVKGCLVFAASGDLGSRDAYYFGTMVNVPASCPHAIGCGGTSKTGTDEVVWNNWHDSGIPWATGGGYSILFPTTGWQDGAPDPPAPGYGRMVPDVAANADPFTGYGCWWRGAPAAFGGTSCVAPLYAGLFAAITGTTHGHRNLGFITPTLFQNPDLFGDITVGDNHTADTGDYFYTAEGGPDACTGLGVPDGQGLAGLFATSPYSTYSYTYTYYGAPHRNPIDRERFATFLIPLARGRYDDNPYDKTFTDVLFSVPKGVALLEFDLVGEVTTLGEIHFVGGQPVVGGGPGAFGTGCPGRVQGRLNVTPGETLTLRAIPGGPGGPGALFTPFGDTHLHRGDGRRGGAAAAIYRGSTLLALAAGAGGAGQMSFAPAGSICGNGGGLVGMDVPFANGVAGAGPRMGGQGATQTVGGAAGDAIVAATPHLPGSAGGHLTGGAGGGDSTHTGGGGGGAGWYSGGGGQGGATYTQQLFGGQGGYGGGGGSSYTAPGSVIDLVHTGGYVVPVIHTPNESLLDGYSGLYVIITMPWALRQPGPIFSMFKGSPPGDPGVPLRLAGRARGLGGVGTRWLAAGDAPNPTP